MKDFPQQTALRDGTTVEFRPLAREDEKALFRFFSRLPEKERLYLREDVADPDTAKRWCEELDYETVLPIVAMRKKRIFGLASLHRPARGWSMHVGGIRAAVDPSMRRKSMASLLFWELLKEAIERGLEIISIELIDKHDFLAQFFEGLGFRREAEMDGLVVDLKGGKHRLTILTNDTITAWRKLKEYLRERGVGAMGQ